MELGAYRFGNFICGVVEYFGAEELIMIYDLIIIGGGPAGVAAGVYAARKKINSAIVADAFGGQSTVSADIQNWIGVPSISGFDFAKSLEKHLRNQEGI